MSHNSALVIGASGGIGAAVCARLRDAGWGVTPLSRRDHGLDLTDPASVEAHLGQLAGPFELILVATGALEAGGHAPEKSLRHVSAEALAAQFALNTIGPALVLRHAPRLMPRDRRAVFAALSARVGSIGDNRLGGWYGYRAAKAALNQILRSGAIEIARTHKQAVVAALHPGTVETGLTEGWRGSNKAVSSGEAAANLLRVIEGLAPEDTGCFRDWAGKTIPW